MPPLEENDLCQKAVYWAFSDYDMSGQPKLSSPVEIDVRWEQARNTTPDSDGNAVGRPTQVKVDREIAIGSVLWLGRLSSLPTPVTNPMEVTNYEETPDIRGREFERWVSLKKHANTNLPRVV